MTIAHSVYKEIIEKGHEISQQTSKIKFLSITISKGNLKIETQKFKIVFFFWGGHNSKSKIHYICPFLLQIISLLGTATLHI